MNNSETNLTTVLRNDDALFFQIEISFKLNQFPIKDFKLKVNSSWKINWNSKIKSLDEENYNMFTVLDIIIIL